MVIKISLKNFEAETCILNGTRASAKSVFNRVQSRSPSYSLTMYVCFDLPRYTTS